MEAKITGIRYRSEPQRGMTFYIAETSQGVVKGRTHLELEPGQHVRLDGEWQISKYNGQREFLFRSLVPCLPVSSRSRFEYACSITRGIGDCLQEKIWDAVGEKWGESDLSGIPGIGRDVRAAWKTTLRELENQRERAEAFAWMMQAGLTANMAAAAWGRWGSDAAGMVKQNPYCLTELPHYGFKTVDAMALESGEWGIGSTDPRRVKAAVLYLLDENAASGGTAIRLGELQAKTEDVCRGIGRDDFFRAMEDSPDVKLLNLDYGEDAASVARKKDFDDENSIWRRWQCN
jgi:hypothetical protein